MSASVSPAVMRVEDQLDLAFRASQDKVAKWVGCDQSRISRKAARVHSGDASWVEVLSGAQLLSVARSHDQVGAAVALAIEGKAQPSGDPASLPLDVAQQISDAADLQRTWVEAQADHRLTAVELDLLLAKAQRARDGLQSMVRDLIAARKAVRS